MKKYIIVMLLLFTQWCIAQQNLQVHPGASVKVHNNEEVAIFGDLQNEGDFDISGSGFIYFYGRTWTNTVGASLGVGTGGVAIFAQPNTLYGTSIIQNIDGGGVGIPFPNISLETPDHVQLINTDSKIRSTLAFNLGSFILNNQNLTVGDGNTGSIQQYDETKFVVTNASNLATSGFLIREQVAAVATDFPVGIALGDYTPARMTNNGLADDFRVRVFENVYTSGTSGNLKNIESVARTWAVEEAIAGDSDVELDLQHNLVTEGASFDPNSNYVARYIGTKPNSVVAFTDSEWDYVGDANCNTNIVPADITTVAPVAAAARNIRVGLDNFTDYTLYAPAICRVSVLPIVLQQIYTQELPNCVFQLVWETAEEQNVSHFEIQGSWDGINFETLGTVAPQQKPARYNFAVNKNISNKTYYLRLKTVDNDATFSNSPLVSYTHSQECLANIGNDYQIYPNPAAQGQVSVRINKVLINDLDGNFEFVDVLGRTVLTIPQVISPAQQTYQLNISRLIAGTYFVKYTLDNQPYLPLKKLIVIE